MAKNEENFKEKSRPKSDFAPEDAFANTRKESTHRCFQRHRRAKDFPPHTKIRALLLVGDLDHTFYPRGWSTAWDPDRVRKIHLSILHQMAFLSDHFNESKYTVLTTQTASAKLWLRPRMETATMKLVLSPFYSNQSSLAYYIKLQRTAVEKRPRRYNREMMRKATIVSELLVTIVCRASKDVNFGVDSDKAKSSSRWGFWILKIVSWAKPRSSFDEFGWIKSTRGCRSEVGRILFGEIMFRGCGICLKSTKIRKKFAFDIRGVWDTRQICINCIQSGRQLSRYIR